MTTDDLAARVGAALLLLLAGCCSGVPCSYVESRAAFEETVLTEYRAYVEADDDLTEDQRALRLENADAIEEATMEARRLCDGE